MKVVATYSIKGGVGQDLGGRQPRRARRRATGLRTVIWDLDPQGAATYLFRVKPKVKGGGAQLIRGRRDPLDVMKGTDIEGLDLLPADFSYRNLDIELDQPQEARSQGLARVLDAARRTTTTWRSSTARRRSRWCPRACSPPPTCCSCR